MRHRNRHLRRWTSMLVLISFLTSLLAPAIEAATLIPVKVPGRHVLFDINTATAAEIAAIPGIGPKTAAEIVRYRGQMGAFKSIRDVGLVKGVGQARLSKLLQASAQGARADLRLKTTRPPKPAVKPAPPKPAPAPVVKVVEPPALWVTGNNGTRVNVNVVDSKGLVRALNSAGFNPQQINYLANTRLVTDISGKSLTFRPYKSYADLHARLNATGAKGIVDGRGLQVVPPKPQAPAPQAPATPAPKAVPGVNGQALVYATGERLMFRYDGGGKAVTVNLNQQSATGLYKQLRDAGVPVPTAKAVAQARMKGSFKNFQDLTGRVPSMGTVAKAPASRSSVTGSQPAAPQAPAPTAAYDTAIAKLTQQHQAIRGRTPTSVTGYDRTLQSLQDTYTSLQKSIAQQQTAAGKTVSGDVLARDPRLQSISRDIQTVQRGKTNLVRAESLNRARVSLDGEIASYGKQAEAVMGRNPSTVKGYDTTIDSMKSTYKDLYSRLEMRARLDGKPVTPEAIAKDARLVKLSEAIDGVRTSKTEFQTQKAANIETAKLQAEQAAVRKADAAKLQAAKAQAELVAKSKSTQAKAPVEPTVVERAAPVTPEPAAVLKSRADYTAKIDGLSAQAKNLFTEIRTESGGRFTSNKDVWEAAKNYDGKGKLAELKKVASDIQSLRSSRNNSFPAEQPAAPQAPKKTETAAAPTKSKQAPAPAKSKAKASAGVDPAAAKPAAPEVPATVVELPKVKPLTEVQALSQQAKSLTAKLVQEGKFTSMQEVFKASEVPGAKGELGTLRGLNDQIRSMRAANKPVVEAPVAKAGATPEVAAVKTAEIPVAVAEPVAPAAKGKWTDGFLKSVKGGQFKSGDGGWADSYMKLLKGDGAHPVAGSPEVVKSETAAPATRSGLVDDYVAMLEGKAPGGQPAVTEAKGGWLKKLFGGRNAQAPSGTVAEAPVIEPLPAETTVKTAEFSTSIKDLQGQAYSLKQRIKETGKFANNAEIFKASEAPTASGDLAALKTVNDQIRALRASKKTAAPASSLPAPEAPAQPGVGQPAVSPETPAPVPTETVVAPKKGFWGGLKDWFTGKNTLAGRARAQAEADAAAGKTGAVPVETPAGTAETPAAATAPKEGGFWGGLKDWFTGKNTLAGRARARAEAEAAAGKGPGAQASETAVPTQLAETPAGGKPGTAVAEPVVALEPAASKTGGTATPASKPAAVIEPLPVAEPIPVAEPVASGKGNAPVAVEPVLASEPVVSKPAQLQQVEAINSKIGTLRNQAHEVASNLVHEGKFANAAEVVRAAETPGASGQLAEVAKINTEIKTLQSQKQAAAAPVVQEGAVPVAPAAGTAAAAEQGFAVRFGSKTQELGTMTARQIEAETGGLISNEAAKKIAETAKANGGKITPQELNKLGLTDEVVTTLRKGNADAVVGNLETARAQAVEKFGANSEAVQKIDSQLQQAKASQTNEPAAQAARSFNSDVLAARTLQLEQVNAQIAKVEGQTGLLAKFTKGKQLKQLTDQKIKLEKEIAGYKTDPKTLETANSAYQQKNQKIFAEQTRQSGVLEAELAKIDPNSRYGRALQERISQIKGTPPESFAKQTTNMFLIAAGTNIMLQLARQMKNGEKMDIGAAVKSVANPQFLLGTAGAAVGAYLGSKVAVSRLGLILTTKLGSFLPPVGRVFLMMLPAMAGGALGGTLAGGGFANADWITIAAETIGSTLGTALAMTMFPGFGLFGQIGAGMMGAEAAKFILKMIRGDPKSEAGADAGGAGDPQVPGADGAAGKASATVGNFTQQDVNDAFQAMGIYYQRYIEFEKQGNYGDAAQMYEKYAAIKARLDGMRSASFQARAK